MSIEIQKIEREPRGYVVAAIIDGRSCIAGIPCPIQADLTEQQILTELETIGRTDTEALWAV